MKKLSSGEKKLLALLLDEFPAYNIRQQMPIKSQKQTLYVDFAIEALSLAFEFDGSQHHKYVEFFHKNQRGFRKSQTRDSKKARALSEAGYTLIRFKEISELNEQILRQKIKDALR